jgi:hypothetical protein
LELVADAVQRLCLFELGEHLPQHDDLVTQAGSVKPTAAGIGPTHTYGRAGRGDCDTAGPISADGPGVWIARQMSDLTIITATAGTTITAASPRR